MDENGRMNRQWYYCDGETPVGPFGPDALEQLFNAGMINDVTLVRHGQSPQWTEYGALRDEILEYTGEASVPLENVPWQDYSGAEAESRLQEHSHDEPAQHETDAASLDHWLLEPVTPWRRYGARMLDLSLNGVFGWFIIGTAFYALAPVSAERFFTSVNPVMDLLLTVVVGVVITGILIGFSGSSIGKWVFGVRVTDVRGRPIGVIAGVMRDISIWIKGLGLGLPLVSLITLYLGYQRLKDKGITSWDESGGYLVSHRPAGLFQYILNTIGILLILFINAFVRSLEQI